MTLLFFLLAPSDFLSAGQNLPGDVSGVVKDIAGAIVAGAKISLINNQQIVLRVAESDADGQFVFRGVAPGTYEVRVTRPDFNDRSVAAQVRAGVLTKVTVVMEVGELAEQVTVTAEVGQAQSVDQVAQQVNIIGEEAIRERATAVLAQAAEEEVGVALQRTSPTIGAVVVRGLTEVAVYVDGVRYTNSTQRGGINTFFNLNEPSSLRTMEILRGTNSAQYGSDSLGGTVQLISQTPAFGGSEPELHADINTLLTSADLSFGGNTLVSYGSRRYGLLMNIAGRRVNTLRPGGGLDSHAAVTRFLGLRSDVLGTRLPDTAFTQYGGTFHVSYAPRSDQQFVVRYQRSQQDGGKRYDQLLGGDGNLIADLRNLMLDLFYARYVRQGFGFFSNASATVSYNSQREERVNQGGQGNPLATITYDKERTSVYGFSFFLDKQASRTNNFLVGGDFYYDRVRAPSFNVDPASGLTTPTRPRVPNGARYLLAGLYVQNIYEAVRERLRLSGALRYNVASYRSRAADSPVVNNRPLFPDDSFRIDDFSGSLGAVATVSGSFNIAFNYSRGFRAPNITSLGSLGLGGVGFQVNAADLAGRGATVGTTADESATSTGRPVAPLVSETSNNFDLSLRFRTKRLDTALTGFRIDYNDTILRQTLILPPGAVGLPLGSQIIESQSASGAVFVPLSPAPVLVQVNFGATRLIGVEYTLALRLARSLIFNGNYSFVRTEDKLTGEPPNLGGGGLPPQHAFLRLRYQQPANRRYWIEFYTALAGRQDRLSSLDLADRRTGATRSRTSIQNFFRRGACVRGLTTPGSDPQCGVGRDGILLATGETLEQVQDRVLGDAPAAPLFTYIPGYGLINLRGGFRFNENYEASLDFENIADKSYRAPGWGVDGPGRSITLRFRYQF